MFKCKHCDFEAKTRQALGGHTRVEHKDKLEIKKMTKKKIFITFHNCPRCGLDLRKLSELMREEK